jgi:hypothetical protein
MYVCACYKSEVVVSLRETAICEPIVLENVGTSTACYRDSFTFFLTEI